MTIEIRRGADRGRTQTDWLDARHSFSYGAYYEPDNLGFGVLTACNEDRLSAGHGYDRHRHRDVEIVTWMLDGQLVHTDDAGHQPVSIAAMKERGAKLVDGRQVLTAGMAQHLGAGVGIGHGEHAAPDRPAHYVQMWVRPSVSGLRTVYAAHDFSAELAGGGWVAIASGAPDSAAPLRLRQLDAELRAIRLDEAEAAIVPAADLAHVQLTRGQVDLNGETLAAGDAARLTDAAAVSIVAGPAAEVLLWMMYR